ncbi:lipopolysaccharide biosynthesis protein-like protein [Caballeronia udeis]|uniref:Lipopolysaccharide biosynthesis protein-like protein n=1 Tax=Caballeronia udeis TaxID=1232866 RepID=A0A158GL53_9BURK|nr:glycoside hydrolase family 99-like domain-containing protein [Caballeronia udeis]SAL32762.1 lipopolysaccharide biosynthesis protein-like protein [Caballeronia udeis]
MKESARAYVLAWMATLLVISAFAGEAPTKAYSVGVYYFPGWKFAPPFAKSPPWDAIRQYGGRKPLLGFYDDSRIDIATQHIRWMHDYGIDFVVYDWYWINDGGAVLTQAIDAYLASPARSAVKFSILWANHTDTPSSLAQFDAIVDYWIRHYFLQESYYRIDGLPVVFIFAPEDLDRKASSFGMNVAQLFERARKEAAAAGIPGIYFVATSQAVAEPVEHGLPAAGYSAISAYNYHMGLSGNYSPDMPQSHSYSELSNGYRQSWTWILTHSRLPYFVPVTSGWDKRPWGGSPDKLHDLSFSVPHEFEEHLKQARSILDQYPDKTHRTVVICCWNEFGEGSFIEPTEKWRFDYLQQVKDVFGSPVQ